MNTKKLIEALSPYQYGEIERGELLALIDHIDKPKEIIQIPQDEELKVWDTDIDYHSTEL
jgi:hypothetical protein